MRRSTLVSILILAACLVPAAARPVLADSPCMGIIVEPTHATTLPLGDRAAITTAIANAIQPSVPLATVIAPSGLPGAVPALQRSMTEVIWTDAAIGSRASVSLHVLDPANASTMFRAGQVVPVGSAQSALVAMATQAGRAIAPQLFCMGLTEHALLVDFDNPAERTHRFTAKVTDLRGQPASGQNVTFSLDPSEGGTLQPFVSPIANGEATTTFTMEQLNNFTLKAEMDPPHQDPLHDEAAITADGDWEIEIDGVRQLDANQISHASQGLVGGLVQAMRAFMRMDGGDPVFNGTGTEQDDLIVKPARTATGLTGTADWTAKIDTPWVSMHNGGWDVIARPGPYTIKSQAPFVGTFTGGDQHHLHIEIHKLATEPVEGGAGSGTGTMKNPNGPGQIGPFNVPIAPGWTGSAEFDLSADVILPAAVVVNTFGGVPPTVVSGSDQLGSWVYTIRVRLLHAHDRPTGR
ncbi:MAG: hypothetical protein KGN76_16060 [Acidobacteriota bacterium]|nr:hypothetical protein [Acidobacteriota bacterium]